MSAKLEEDLRKSVNCDSTDMYECLRAIPAAELLKYVKEPTESFLFHPMPDGDFFPKDAVKESYNLTKRSA